MITNKKLSNQTPEIIQATIAASFNQPLKFLNFILFIINSHNEQRTLRHLLYTKFKRGKNELIFIRILPFAVTSRFNCGNIILWFKTNCSGFLHAHSANILAECFKEFYFLKDINSNHQENNYENYICINFNFIDSYFLLD